MLTTPMAKLDLLLGYGLAFAVAALTASAVAGGFTAVVAMPNTRPVNDTAAITMQASRAICVRWA